jgi:TPR repeat protein
MSLDPTNSIKLHLHTGLPETDSVKLKNRNSKKNGRIANLFSNPWTRRALWAAAAVATAAVAYAAFQKLQLPPHLETCILYEAKLDPRAGYCYLKAAENGSHPAQVRMAAAYLSRQLGFSRDIEKHSYWVQKALESGKERIFNPSFWKSECFVNFKNSWHCMLLYDKTNEVPSSSLLQYAFEPYKSPYD